MISNIHFAYLEVLYKERDPYIRKVLLFAFCKDKKFIKALRYLCVNTLQGKFAPSAKETKELKKYISDLRLFSNKKKITKKKIIQNGAGFLTALIPIAAAILGPIINGAFSKDDNGSK